MANTVETMGSEALLSKLIDGSLTELEDEEVTSLPIYVLRSSTSLNKLYLKSCTRLYQEPFIGSSKLSPAFLPAVTTLSTGQFTLTSSTSIRAFSLPALTSGTPAMSFNNNSVIAAVDFGPNGPGTLSGNWAYNATALDILVFRKNGIVAAGISLDANLFGSNSKFHSGKAGGVIYIPKTIYDHLGDGTSLDYYRATNWSAANGRASILFMPIEGSFYEHRYVDGMIISNTPTKEADSISATYTDTNNVVKITPNTNLETLKYLTVVKGFSNGVEFDIPTHHYTLSGSLNVGVSPITVTYMDKTTTFNVTVSGYQNSLPSGYTELTCIIGDGQQYIIFDFNETQEFYAEYAISENWKQYFYSGYPLCTSNTYFPYLRFDRTGAKMISVLWRGTTTTPSYDWKLCTLYCFTADLIDTGDVTVNGVSVGTATKGSTALSSSNMYRAGSNAVRERNIYGAIYYMRLYQSNALVHNFIPARKDSTGGVGLYDTVTDVFYESSATVPFIAG